MAGGGEKPEVGRMDPRVITAVQLRQQEEKGRDGHRGRCGSEQTILKVEGGERTREEIQ